MSDSIDSRDESKETIVNIVLAGAEKVGKTAILARFMGDLRFFDTTMNSMGQTINVARDYEPTIGADFRTYANMELEDKSLLTLNIWDSSGNPLMEHVGNTTFCIIIPVWFNRNDGTCLTFVIMMYI